jgi:hypothetical protein
MTVYGASLINPRRRATRDEMAERARFFIRYAARHSPVTVRQLYYRAAVEGIQGIDKTDAGYIKVQRQVLNLRREKRLPYRHIADATRWMRKPITWDSIADALRATAETYRKALWRDCGNELEIWLEKNALAGVIYPVTSQYDVPLMPTVGFTSETFAFEAVEGADSDKLLTVSALYDFDRAGQDAARSLQEKLERFAAERGIEVSFQCLAIEESDIDLESFDRGEQAVDVYLQGVGWRRLPTREPKRKSDADKNWPHPFAIELDAIEPDDLRSMVRYTIEHYLPADQLKILQTAEENEQQAFRSIAKMLAPDPADHIGDGSGEHDPLAHYEARIAAIDDWIRRGAPGDRA